MIRQFRATTLFWFSDSAYPDLEELCNRIEEKIRSEMSEWVEAIAPGYPEVVMVEKGPFGE